MGPVLIGLRGSGKSTLAPMVARALGMDWADTDRELEVRHGEGASTLLRTRGEPAFRRLEREVALDLLDRAGTVVATGGGAVLDDDVRAACRSRFTVWLHASLDTLSARVAASDRPSLTGRPPHEEIADVGRQRESLYRETATLYLDTTHRAPEETADSIVDGWKRAERERDG
jgi:shikimate kinase